MSVHLCRSVDRSSPFATQISLKLVVLATLFACDSTVVRADLQPDVKTFDLHIRPLLQKYCVKCHGGKTPKADIGLDSIDPDIIAGEHFDKWEDVREAFNTGEMPPEDKPQPTDAERDLMTR